MSTLIESYSVQEMEVIEVVNAIGTLADRREFSALRSLLEDELDVDYSSLTGRPRSKMNADELIAGWTKGLSRFHSTEHVAGQYEVRIEGNRADCQARFIATHVHDAESGSRWTMGGSYRYTLRRHNDSWKVLATTMNMEWEQGPR